MCAGKPLTSSGVMPHFLFGMFWSLIFYMLNEFWPDYGLGAVLIVGYAISTLLLVSLKIRKSNIENDKALLLIHAFNCNSFSISLILLYNFNPLLGPLATNAVILVWGLIVLQVVFRLTVKITTARDVYLWLFPISYASNLVQMVLFTDSLSTKERFALMILIQEAQSIFTNTGCKDWVVHQVKLRLGKQGHDMNPFHNKEIFHDIASRASINTLSEFTALTAVFVAVIGDYVARGPLGATGIYCTTICGRSHILAH